MMECNRDEAVRAKEIAERKFAERDFAGAKKFALKAQNLYPELEGLPQMLVTFDVHASAEKRTINGEVDWYSVLGSNPWSDDETIRRQYRKLALTLHPDKNKSLGADGAFKLVSEAWSFLSNKANRLPYDERLKVSTQTKVQSAANGFYHGNNVVNSGTRAQKSNKRTAAASVPSPSYPKPETFWTICNKCKTQYEYMRTYLNHTLLCPNCQEAFFAVERAPPPNLMKSPGNPVRQKNSKNRSGNNSFNVGRNSGVAQSSGVNSNGSEHYYNNFSRMAGTGAGASVGSPSTTGVQQTNQRVKREHEEEKGATGYRTSNSDHLSKRRKTSEVYGASLGNGKSGLGSGYEQRRSNFDTEKVYGFSGNKSNIKRELSPLELRNLLIGKAKLDISRKLEEWSLDEVKLRENGKTKNIVRNAANGHEMHRTSAITNEQNKTENLSPGFKSVPVSINVPDSDFHNFDLDRTESSFREDQVWAAYDDDDGMPRYYARIQKVMSRKPFKVKISWLNSRSSSEFGSVDWVGSGFLKTSGDFRAGRYVINEKLNSFSHKVKWLKGVRGLIRILPTKGDVWALYRNWSVDWNQNTPDEVVHQYEMVEVLDDYNEEQGVTVAPLTKVAGFKAVFRRHADDKEVRRIPKEEMFRFSHPVPDHVLTGEEGPNAPRGCWELDPAATPLELLQVTTEANEVESTENTEEIAVNYTDGNIDQISEKISKFENEALESPKQSNDNS
ncbi:DNAJ heat shock N-terminal domain-containing protein [Euphorbia peplus]|nr:DNAJ heat shock N-terminal domain-containing protein [Euphorbia peplus]